MGEISLSVIGGAAGQQVRLAFTEFSGTGNIGLNQEFSIPSGQFSIGSGIPGQPCVGTTLFEGQFSGNSVSGTEQGNFTCPAPIGQIMLSGTFEASVQIAKLNGLVDGYKINR